MTEPTKEALEVGATVIDNFYSATDHNLMWANGDSLTEEEELSLSGAIIEALVAEKHYRPVSSHDQIVAETSDKLQESLDREVVKALRRDADNLRELAAWRTRCYIQQLREHADAEARAVEVEAERDAMERAIRGHGGSVLRGEFVLRGGKTSPIYVEWPS